LFSHPAQALLNSSAQLLARERRSVAQAKSWCVDLRGDSNGLKTRARHSRITQSARIERDKKILTGTSVPLDLPANGHSMTCVYSFIPMRIPTKSLRQEGP